jgi:hypothetical protein
MLGIYVDDVVLIGGVSYVGSGYGGVPLCVMMCDGTLLHGTLTQQPKFQSTAGQIHNSTHAKPEVTYKEMLLLGIPGDTIRSERSCFSRSYILLYLDQCNQKKDQHDGQTYTGRHFSPGNRLTA